MTLIPDSLNDHQVPIRSKGPPVGRLCGLLLLLAINGCSLLQTDARPLVPTRYKSPVGPFTLYTSDPTPPEVAMEQLKSLEQQLEATLGLKITPAIPPIEIYVLDDEHAFSTFLKFHHPELPNRRAFFLAKGSRRVIYTALGDRLIEDLRHEATHALLHATVGTLPLWLDEGLAEFFEAPPDEDPERASRHLLEIASGRTPDLLRLESLEELQAMESGDYREAWAWTHYLLLSSPTTKRTLLGYLADLRGPTRPEPLSQRLERDPEILGAEFLAHLRAIGDRNSNTIVRYQDAQASAPAERLVPRSEPAPPKPAPAQAPILVQIPLSESAPGRPGLGRRLRDRFEALADRLKPSPPRGSDRSWPPG